MHLAILTGETSLSGITSAMETLMSLAGTFINFVVENPVLCLFFALGIAGGVFGIVKKAKRI